MTTENLRRGALAAIPGGICISMGIVAGIVDELDYRGLAQDTIPDAVAIGSSMVGALLLMVAFTSIHRLQGGPGAAGYWIGMAGLLLSVAPIWPLIVFGPVLLGIGLTIYAATTMTAGRIRSFGSWMHLVSVPGGVITGAALAAAGFDGGIGMVMFLTLLVVGLMILGFDAATAVERDAPVEAAA